MKHYRNPYVLAFLMVASLFFIWGFCHAMLDVLNKHFQNLLSLSKTQSGLIQTAFFLAYLLVAFPAAKLIRRIGYQRGILVGLVILAIGAFMFIPAGMVFKTFDAFLVALFVLASGLACIETAANPYVTVLGPKDSAAGRLSVAQAFNSCAYILAPTVGGFLLFGQKVDPEHPDFHPLLLPYIVLGCVVLLIFTVFSFVKLPVIAEGTKIGETDDATIIKAPLSRQPHFKWGVFTQFLYIISQIGINAFAVNYIVDNAIVKDAAGTQTTSPFFSWYGNLMHAFQRRASDALHQAEPSAWALWCRQRHRSSGGHRRHQDGFVAHPAVELAFHVHHVPVHLRHEHPQPRRKDQDRRVVPCDGRRRRRLHFSGRDGLALGSFSQRWDFLHAAADRLCGDRNLRFRLSEIAREI
jgi:MFS family permease